MAAGAVPTHGTTPTHYFLTLCLRIAIPITNYEQGDNPGREKLTL
jgi:hypothetical protein